MKNILVLCLLVFSTLTFARGGHGGGSVHVNSYVRSNGTFVQAHYRTSPNNTRADNYSTVGNVNPYTGKKGTHRDYYEVHTIYQPSNNSAGVQPITYYYDRYIDVSN